MIVFIDNFSPKLKSVAKLKQALQLIWDNLPSTIIILVIIITPTISNVP